MEENKTVSDADAVFVTVPNAYILSHFSRYDKIAF